MAFVSFVGYYSQSWLSYFNLFQLCYYKIIVFKLCYTVVFFTNAINLKKIYDLVMYLLKTKVYFKNSYKVTKKS